MSINATYMYGMYHTEIPSSVNTETEDVEEKMSQMNLSTKVSSL